MADPYRYFRIEAGEILEQLQAGLLELEKGAPPAEIVAKLLRLAHTLKGAARVVKQKGIADLSHSVEDLLVPIRDAGSSAAGSVIQQSLMHVDAMQALLRALSATPSGGSEAGAAGPARPVLLEQPAEAKTEVPFWAAKPNTQDLDRLMDGITELNVQLGGVKSSQSSLERIRGLTELLRDRLAVRRLQPAGESELLELRQLTDDIQSALIASERELATGVEQATRELGEIRDAAERLRLVPAELLWGSLERTARDAALSLGKKVRFDARGGEVRLEAELLGQVQRALMQAVRNSVAHGIESPAARAAAQKPAEGSISIEVSRRGKHVVFSCTDDGHGLDFESIRQKAQQRGISAAVLAELDEDGLARLLLQGGISTAASVTGVAGRGIGLDLIRETAQKLGGTVSLRSAQGTRLALEIPVSLSALAALLVEVDGQVVALPLSAVRGTARQIPDEVTHTAEGDTVLVAGQVMPYVALHRLLASDAQGSFAIRSAVWVEADGGMAALGVERLLGIEGIVARAVPELALLSPVVSGASFDAEGNPRLVLSAEGIIQSVRRVAAAPRVAPRARLPILVIDDSLTTRMLEQSILESAGYDVDLAVSGEDGMVKAAQRKYALFLVDVEMPGMDGFTFIERTRKDPVLREVPAILVTSRASAEDVERGRAAGAVAHIEKKEFNQTDLLERIRRLVS
jgi:two-component system chemotaxis sensor kinase CheA